VYKIAEPQKRLETLVESGNAKFEILLQHEDRDEFLLNSNLQGMSIPLQNSHSARSTTTLCVRSCWLELCLSWRLYSP